MKINDKISFRTAGRGQIKTWKGTVRALVKAGQTPAKKFWPMLNHANKPSNRDRAVVELTTGDFAWANTSGPNTAGPGEKLKEYRRRGDGRNKRATPAMRRRGIPAGTSNTKVARIKEKMGDAPIKPSKLAKPAKRKSAAKQIEENMRQQPEPTVVATVPDVVPNPLHRKHNPKKTWYGPNGEVVRKILCPDGFLATKPEKTTAAESVTTGVESLTETTTADGYDVAASAPEPITIDEHTPEPTDAVSLNSAG